MHTSFFYYYFPEETVVKSEINSACETLEWSGQHNYYQTEIKTIHLLTKKKPKKNII